MKLKTFLSFTASLALILAGGNAFAQSSSANGENKSAAVEITFDYSRKSTRATNQTAVWIEDENGKVVKTIYVSAFTSSGRGYRRRKDSLNRWVAAANPESLSKKEIDALSGATLRTGSQKFTWDLTGSDGRKVSDGRYFVKLEGTLYWSSSVLYSSQIDIFGGDIKTGEVQESRSEESNRQNEDMIQNVRIEKIL